MKNFAFIGAGNMAGAIIEGMCKSSLDCNIYVYDLDFEKSSRFEYSSVSPCRSFEQAVENAHYVVLAVKPQNYGEVLKSLSGVKGIEQKVFVSIAAGITTDSVCEHLGFCAPVIRTMPNTPMLIGEGVTALCRNSKVNDEDFDGAVKVFSLSGSVILLNEEHLNTVICATSSSPAYVYLFIKSIYEEALSQGLPEENLLETVCNVVIGSAKMLLSTGKTPEELIKMVTSPGGTTERAMNVFKENGFEKIVSDAMKACSKRAEELSKSL